MSERELDAPQLWQKAWVPDKDAFRVHLEGSGATGPQGVTGVQGTQGETGVSFGVGATGPQGVTGVQGETGAQGETGIQGATGVQGAAGETGIQGDTGAQGLQGDQGDTGIQGLQGDTGVQGDTGIQGATGVGAQGETGIQGVTGIQGETGVQGATGVEPSPTHYDVGGVTGTVGIDWDNGKQQECELLDNVTFYHQNGQAANGHVLKIVQDGTGNRTAGWTGVYWPSATAPTLSTGGGDIDFVGFLYDGTNYYGVATENDLDLP